MKLDDILQQWRVPHDGKKVKLKDYDPDWDGDDSIPKDDRKNLAAELLADCEISPAERDEAIALSELLDAFNNGQFTESCDDDDDGGDGADGVD